jgi:DNA-binding NarL/FixJ family response regulator
MSDTGNASAWMPPAPDTVLIADDHPLVRTGIKMLVNGVLGAAQFLEVDDGDGLLRAIAARPPVRLALIDLQMPRMFGGLRLAEIAQSRVDVPLIVLSSISSPDLLRKVMSIPTVYAFLPKSASTEAVHAAIAAALERRRFAAVPKQAGSARAATRLTPRQDEIHALLRHGMSNKTIAAELGISEGTVKNHITEIFKALNTSNRTQAARLEIAAD